MAWCAEKSRPFSIVKDQSFRNMILTGNPERRLPTPDQISRDVKVIVTGAETQIRERLEVRQCHVKSRPQANPPCRTSPAKCT